MSSKPVGLHLWPVAVAQLAELVGATGWGKSQVVSVALAFLHYEIVVKGNLPTGADWWERFGREVKP